MAVLFQQPLIQTAAVDADANGDVLVLAHLHHRLHPILPADVAGVDADFAGAALGGGDGQLIIKVNVRNQRQGAFLTDFRKASGRLPIGHGQPGNLTARRRQSANLPKTSLHIRGFGVEHGLDDHRGTAADGHTAD